MKQSKLCLLVLSAAMLAGCNPGATSSAAAATTSTGTDTSVAINSSSPTSVAEKTAHAITIEKDAHVNVYLSSESAKAGETIKVSAVVEGAGYTFGVVVKVNDTAISMTADPLDPGALAGSFTMPDAAVVVKATSSDIYHKVSFASTITGAEGFFFASKPADADLESVTSNAAMSKVDTAKFGSVYYFEPVTTAEFDSTKDLGDVKNNGTVVDAVGYNSYGNYYQIIVGAADVAMSVEVTDRAYLAMASDTTENATITFKATIAMSIHFSKAVAGATVSFTVSADEGYGIASVFATAASGTDVALTYAEGAYSFTQPAESVAISVNTEATNYPILVNKITDYGFSVSSFTTKHGEDAEATLAGSDPKIAYAGDIVTFSVYDTRDDLKADVVMMNGIALIAGTPDSVGTVNYSFTMPACQAVITVTTTYDYHAIAVTGSDHFSGTLELYTTSGSTETSAAITEAYSGQKVYIKTNAMEIQDATSSKWYGLQKPVVTYTDGTTTTNVTVTLDTKKNEYYFGMPAHAVSVVLGENEEVWHGKTFVGTYYGGYNGGTNTTIVFASDGSIV